MDAGLGDPLRDLGAELIDVVGQDLLFVQDVAGRFEAFDQQLAGFVGCFVAGVGDREHGDAHGDAVLGHGVPFGEGDISSIW